MRSLARFLGFLVLCMGLVSPVRGVAIAEEKSVTPLAAGIPMIEGIKMLEAGTEAPDFSIKDTQGAAFTLTELKGKKAVVLVFWSIFCEPCRVEMPIVQKLYDKYKDEGLDMAAIALDGDPLKSSIVGFIKQENYTFRVLIDELDSKDMFKVADPYGVGGTPTVFLIDKAGKIVLAKAGQVKEEELEKAIQTLMKK
jgi:peroxiredoxin